MSGHTFVRRTNDSSSVYKLLHPVCAPSCDPRDGEQRSIQFIRKIQHTVNKTAVKIDICADAFIYSALFGNDFFGQLFYIGI